jgi:hypothetical protein
LFDLDAHLALTSCSKEPPPPTLPLPEMREAYRAFQDMAYKNVLKGAFGESPTEGLTCAKKVVAIDGMLACSSSILRMRQHAVIVLHTGRY